MESFWPGAMNNEIKVLIKELGSVEGEGDPANRIESVNKIKSALAGMREGVKNKHLEGYGGVAVSVALTETIDFLIEELFKIYSPLTGGGKTPLENSGINLSIVAVGGYGRNELQPCSDIDIFFLFKGELGKIESEIVSGIVTALWDFGYEVGHVARTASECIAIIKSDIPSKTALIDSRFLLGNHDIYREFKARLTAEITKNSVQSIIGAKLYDMHTRHKKHGDTVFVAEPHIKEGVGGLRDYQTALWVSAAKFDTNTIKGLKTRGIIDSTECETVTDSVDFLLRVRNELHFLTSRREDTLLFEFQKQVAQDLGYGDQKGSTDNFLKEYFQNARTVARFSKSTLHKCKSYKRFSPFTLLRLKKRNLGQGFERIGDLIFVKGYNPEIFKKEPILLLDVFLLCQKKDLTLSEPLKKLVTFSHKTMDNSFFNSMEVHEKILRVFSGQFTGKVLRLMHETEVLEKILPEIGSIVLFSAKDHYHFYTVDEHTLRTIEIFDTLYWKESAPELYKIYMEIEEKEIVLFALLFHDIQKIGTDGHAERGAKIAGDVLERWGLGKKAEKIIRLVRFHVLMGRTAFRRDLDDIQVIQEFSNTINNVEELKNLYVMTCADIKSVSPAAWSEWKGVMLKELFLRSYTYLENRDTLSDSLHVVNKKEEFYASFPELKQEIDSCLKYLPNSYILSMLTEHLPRYIDLMKTMESSNISIGFFKNSKVNHWELMVCTRSKPGVFAKIAGTLSLNSINILAGQIFTRPDKVAIDLFKVSAPALEGGSLSDDIDQAYKEKMATEFWERIECEIRAVLENKVKIDELLDKRSGSKKSKTSSSLGIKTRVELLSDISDAYTVIDVVTEDRPALLYKLTDTLYKNGLNIHLAKVITEGKTVIDVFYVTDLDGNKLKDQERSGEIVSSIISRLSGK